MTKSTLNNDTAAALGVLMLDLEGLEVNQEEQELLACEQVGGVILFSRNYSCVNQLVELTQSVREHNPALLIAVDQEGGRVQRFRDEFAVLPALRKIGIVYKADPQKAMEMAENCAWLMATELLSCGLDFSFAPVLDLFSSSSKVIGDRAFSDDPAIVASLALAYIEGLHNAGMSATGKHFPGHGTVVADSHIELPIDEREFELIQQLDLVPFQQCVDQLDAIMPAHVIYPKVAAECAGFSHYWLQDVLRTQMKFDGVIFSDDLTMAAAESVGSVEKRAEAALDAGCDMLLVCNDRDSAVKVLNWLDRKQHAASMKLGSMRGDYSYGVGRDAILNSQKCQHAKAMAEQLVGSK